jgi:hypothetical protein
MLDIVGVGTFLFRGLLRVVCDTSAGSCCCRPKVQFGKFDIEGEEGVTSFAHMSLAYLENPPSTPYSSLASAPYRFNYKLTGHRVARVRSMLPFVVLVLGIST